VTPHWDVVVVGAGPAGSIIAILAARSGLRTLLIDRADFPRRKVCGGCLSIAGVDLLRKLGLRGVLDEIDARPFRGVRLTRDRSHAHLDEPEGMVLLRDAFDDALRRSAIACGAHVKRAYALSTHSSCDCRAVRLRVGSRDEEVRASAVVGCTGLGGAWLDEIPERVHSTARIGFGTVVPNPGCVPPHIDMHLIPGGYIGRARTASHMIIAASLSRDSLKKEKPADVLAKALPSGVEPQHWNGAPALTRSRRHVAASRLFLAGDACGYVEPMTGEGMTWAIACAASLAPIVRHAIRSGDFSGAEQHWNAIHTKSIARRRRLCHGVRFAIGSPLLAVGSMGLLRSSHLARSVIARSIMRPYRIPA